LTLTGGNTWYNPYGILPKPENPNERGIHASHEAYRAIGYPKEIHDIGDKGVVGSLIGWIENDKAALEKAFVVGEKLKKQVAREEIGYLHLAVNDARGRYGDNQGEFDVSIELTHPAGKQHRFDPAPLLRHLNVTK
jgi:hypothetical protein